MTNDNIRHNTLLELDILDTPREPQFDSAVELTKIVCNTSGALISLLDEKRQWFKSSFGFDVAETAIEQSICMNCLDTDDVVVFNDLSKDARTSSSTLVTGSPNLRFYAGAAIRGAPNVRVGALCVLDTQPRPNGLSADQMIFLKSKADEISGLLMLRRAMKTIAIVD